MSESIKQPYYNLSINGKELGELRMSYIRSIAFEDSATGSDLLKVSIDDPDLIFIQDDIFVEEATISFVGGFLKGGITQFDGYISVIDIDYPESGTPTITLNCMDRTHIMNREKKKKTWENIKVSDIASQIFRSYGFTAKVDDTGTKEESISQDATDIEFLVSQASEQYENYLCYLEGNTGYFIKKPSVGTPQDTLSYREADGKLFSFSPRINKQTKKKKITHSNVNLKDNKVDTGSANDTTPRSVSGNTHLPDDKPSTQSNSSTGNWQYDSSTGQWTQK